MQSSIALDLTTIGHALTAFREAGVVADGWESVPGNQAQVLFLKWYRANQREIEALTGLAAKASPDYRVLNRYLDERGFQPTVDPFNDGIGVVSVLDMIVKWAVACSRTTLSRRDSSSAIAVPYPAFEVPAGGVRVYTIQGYSAPLIRLSTTSGHSLWLMKSDEPQSGLELALKAHSVLSTPRVPHSRWTGGVIVPMLNLSVDPDLSWLCGLSTGTGGWFISQANQQFRLRADQMGAHVEVATVIVAARSLAPEPYALNESFIGFMTQPGHDTLPMAAFWACADDSWKNPTR